MGPLSGYAAALVADPRAAVAMVLLAVAVTLCAVGVISLVAQLRSRGRSGPFGPAAAVHFGLAAGLSVLAAGITS